MTPVLIFLLFTSLLVQSADLSIAGWRSHNYSNISRDAETFHGSTVYGRNITPFLFSPDFRLNLKQGHQLCFDLKIDRSCSGRLFFRPEGGKFNDSDRIEFKTAAGPGYRTYRILLPVQDRTIVQFRLDLFAHARVSVKNIRLQKASPGTLALRSSGSENRVPDFSPCPSPDQGLYFPHAPTASARMLAPGERLSIQPHYINFQSPSKRCRLELELDLAGAPTGDLQLTIFPEDIFGKPMKSFSAGFSAASSRLDFSLPERAACIRLTLQSALSEKVLIREARLSLVYRTGDNWQAKWISPAGSVAGSNRLFFRRNFHLDKVPDRAELQIAFDDQITAIWINGRQLPLPPNAAAVRVSDLIDILPFLQQGQNLLAVSGIDFGGEKGMCCELGGLWGDSYRLLLSDSRFRGSSQEQPGWQQPSFDDSGWSPVLQGSHSLSRTIPHHYMGKEGVQLTAAGSCPAPAPPNDLPRVQVCYAANSRTPRLLINGVSHSVTHLFTTDFHQDQVRNLKKNDVHLYWLSETRPIWLNEGKYDFTPIDRAVARLLSQDPEAFLTLQIPVDTFLLPTFSRWLDRNPGEAVLDSDGRDRILVHGVLRRVPSWASDAWLREIRRYITACVKHVRKQPYASRIIGFMPIAGLGAEWMYYGAHDKLYVDYSRPFQRKYQQYLQKKYSSVQNLNKSWHSSYRSFSEISIPSREERNSPGTLHFLDVSKHMTIIDFRLFFSELVSDVVLALGDSVKKASDGRSLYGTYYGYITYTATENWSENGHFALGKMLKSPVIDFLVSLVRYDNRRIGHASGGMAPAGSFRLHGKAMIAQADLRTHRFQKAGGSSDNLGETAGILNREMAWSLIKGWGFEFGYYGYGWFCADPRLSELIGKFREIEDNLADSSVFAGTDGQIAMIVDDASACYIPQNSPYYRIGNRELVRQLSHCGTGFDCYLLEDLPKITEQYKIFIFSNTYMISPETADFIRNRLAGKGRILIWLHAPGITDGKSWNPNLTAELTGFKFRMELRTAAPDSPYVMFRKMYPYKKIITAGPVMIPENGKILLKDKKGMPLAALGKFPDWTSVYIWPPNLAADALQNIIRKAGGNIINTNTADATYAAGRILAIHTDAGGERILNLPGKDGTMTELFTGKVSKIENGKCRILLPPKSTALFLRN